MQYKVNPLIELGKKTSTGAVMLYIFISQNNGCGIPYSELAEILGISRPTITRLVKQLADAGYIRTQLKKGENGVTTGMYLWLNN